VANATAARAGVAPGVLGSALDFAITDRATLATYQQALNGTGVAELRVPNAATLRGILDFDTQQATRVIQAAIGAPTTGVPTTRVLQALALFQTTGQFNPAGSPLNSPVPGAGPPTVLANPAFLNAERLDPADVQNRVNGALQSPTATPADVANALALVQAVFPNDPTWAPQVQALVAKQATLAARTTSGKPTGATPPTTASSIGKDVLTFAVLTAPAWVLWLLIRK
jgi:hypothetical protein